jgi:hypothetical protein
VPVGFRGIRPSAALTGEFALISLEVAACHGCLRHTTEPGGRLPIRPAPRVLLL